ncbi:DUF2007 domain-containing protein [bacterium]|nr:DUF2007 domain-containing protein [bacterium]
MTEEKIFCPACGAEIASDDETRCPSCKLELKAADMLMPDMTRESDDLISLFKLNDLMEAQLIKTQIEDAGIPCVVSEGGMTSVLGIATPSGFSFTRIKVMVPASKAKDAITALGEYKKWSETELNRYLSMLDEM